MNCVLIRASRYVDFKAELFYHRKSQKVKSQNAASQTTRTIFYRRLAMKIELQKWSWQDKQALIKICDSVDRTYLSNRLPHPYTEESADWWLNMLAENDGKTGIFRKIIADGEIVGNITVEKKSDVYSCDSEIGYILLAEKYSKGIMTEAVRQICELAFSALDITRITGLVYEPNVASRRVLEKNNFVLEGVKKNAVAKNGEIYDLRIYGKIK